MKKINYLKKSLYKDIVFTILFVLVSIPIWLTFDVSELEEAKKYDNYNYVNYEFLNSPVHTLESVSDDYALRNIETSDLVVYNYTMADASYSLVLKIDKKSTASLNNIKLNVNFEISYLTDLPSYEDDDYYYYVIDSSRVQGSSQKYALSMWNDENNKLDSNDVLDYEFVIL